MTEPTRDALHAETLVRLEGDIEWEDSNIAELDGETDEHWQKALADSRKARAEYAYAAACVKRIKQMQDADCVLMTKAALDGLTAEVERLRAITTPPTPDLDAVVARVSALATMHAATPDTNARAVAADLRALLAAVSRPAEARGEPVAWGLRDKTTGRINAARGQRANAERVAVDLLTHSIEVDIVPLYTHPAPSGGEGVKPEMVKVALDEADRDLREGETFASVLAASLNRQMAAPRPEPGDVPMTAEERDAWQDYSIARSVGTFDQQAETFAKARAATIRAAQRVKP